MIIIEKVEISYFRSFGEKSVKITNLRDLNVFSGANDAGKSNVLRALNLFFNNRINGWEEFDLNKDLSFLQKVKSDNNLENKKKQRTDDDKYASQRDLFVKVKVFFTRPKATGTTPKEFWVSKKWYRNGRLSQEDNLESAYKNQNSKEPTPRERSALKGKLTQFLGSINFEYIPAVKDRNFFRHLFEKLQESVLDRDNKFKSYSDQINKNIQDITVDLFKEFKDRTNIDAQFEIPKSLINFFSTIGVSTENEVSLFARGDGIQARFIPAILNEISKGQKYVIWGFEEPENSYEYRNAERLAQDFLNKYCEDKQIFITSHTKEFLSLIKDNENKVSLHRVYKSISKGSLIETYRGGFDKENIQKNFWEDVEDEDQTQEGKDTLNKIFDDIGFLETDQYVIEELQEKLKTQRQILNTSNLSLKSREEIISKLNQKLKECILSRELLERQIESYTKPQVFVEDEKIAIYQVAWLKINEKEFDNKNYEKIFEEECLFRLMGKGGRANLQKFLNEPKVEERAHLKIVGVFDFDEAFTKDFCSLKNGWGEIMGNESDCLYRKRNDYNFYAAMIPVPLSRKLYAERNKAHNCLEIEHLFEDDFLQSIKSLAKEKNVAGDFSVIQVMKKKLVKNLFTADKKIFNNFEPLFKRIEGLLFG